VVLVEVRGGSVAPEGTLAARPLRFWRTPDGWRALAPLPIETAPGPAAAAIVAGVPLSATLEVVEPGFRTTTLSVSPRFVEPPPKAKRRIAADRKAFAAAFDQPFRPPLFQGPFGWPRAAGTTGRFGDRRTFNGTQASVHYGLDIDGALGAEVTASNDGEVVLARDCYMSGNSVVVWHGAGVYTVYFHLSRMEVRSGQAVKRGDRIGLVGATGRATGPHLHWSVKVDGLYVDPESLLRVDAAAPSPTVLPPVQVAPAAAAPSPAVSPPSPP
jgi:murein DD-endopeptidase MepM/ murein hydrolase activator NlpD